MLDRAKRAWGTGESHAIIEDVQQRLRDLQERAMHRNPPAITRAGQKRNYQSQVVGTLSREVHAVLYRHIEDGKQYRHDFERPTSMLTLFDGERNDVLITSPDGSPVWQDF